MNRNEMLKECKNIIKENHPDLKNLKIYPMGQAPKHWFQYHGRKGIKFVNRWSIKTYPTGLKKKQIYVIVEGKNYHKTIFDVTLETDGRIFMHSMGRWF